MESEPHLEFTDKRRVHLDDAPAASAAETAPDTELTPESGSAEVPVGKPEDATAAPADEETAEELPALDVYGLLKTTISLLSNGAWAWMGLTPNPFTGKMERDIAQAKVAIDTVGLLVGQLDPTLTPDERSELQNLVSMLRLNFVQQTQKS